MPFLVSRGVVRDCKAVPKASDFVLCHLIFRCERGMNDNNIVPEIDVDAELAHVGQEIARKQAFQFSSKWPCVAFLTGSSSPDSQYEVSPCLNVPHTFAVH
jgi:hypothetical protein